MNKHKELELLRNKLVILAKSVVIPENIRALSIRQPWAYAIVHGSKRIENRTWPTKRRGIIAIHAGLAIDNKTVQDYNNFCKSRNINESSLKQYDVGSIIGLANLVDCVETSKDPWFQGPYGFVLDNIVPLKDPIPCKGALQFFKLSPEVLDQILEQLGE